MPRNRARVAPTQRNPHGMTTETCIQEGHSLRTNGTGRSETLLHDQGQGDGAHQSCIRRSHKD